jgi:flagellar hook-length control protein FliK
VAFALELNALWLGGPDVRADTEAGTSLDAETAQGQTGKKSCATKREIGPPSRDAGQNVSLTGKTQWPVAYRQFAEASLETDQDAKAPVVPPAGQAEPAEPMAQPKLQTTPSLVTSPLSNPPAQLNLEGSDQPARAYGEFSGVSPLTSGEPKSGEPGPVKTSVSSSSTAKVTQHAESQVTADWTGHYFGQPDAGLSVAPEMLQPPSAQPQVLMNGDANSTSGKPGSSAFPSAGTPPNLPVAGAPGAFGTVVTHSENLLGQAQPADSAGPQRNEGQNQDDDGQVIFNSLASGAELTSRGAGLSRDIAIPHADSSSVTQYRIPASDKSADSDRAGKSRDNNEGTSASNSISPATSVWTQAVSDPNSASDATSQGSQQGYLADRAPIPTPSKSAFASAVQKASVAGSDAGSEMAVDPRQGMRWNSDTQNGSAPSSADSSTNHAPTFPNGEGAMEHSVQNVSSARLADTTGQSEIQVNLKSDSWGPVSVHATLSNGQVGAEIQVSDRDAHAALTEALHTLEKNLGENGIQVSNLNVSHGLGYSHAQSQNQQEKQTGQSTYAARSYTHRSAVSDDIPVASKGVNTIDDFVLGRVSVRA